MANEQNLLHGNPETQFVSGQKAAENGRKGGIESGKTRRLQGAIKRALQSRASSAELNELFEGFGIEEGSRDYATAIACAVVNKAAKGDLSAAGFVRDSIGEKPKDEISLDGGVVIVDDLTNSVK